MLRWLLRLFRMIEVRETRPDTYVVSCTPTKDGEEMAIVVKMWVKSRNEVALWCFRCSRSDCPDVDAVKKHRQRANIDSDPES